MKWDIGTLNQTPFVYVAAFGAFTEVAYDTPQDLKNTFGHLAYIAAGIASIPSITPYHLRVEYDDGQVLEDDFFYGMVCNTYSVAGMKNLPTDHIELDDGRFEVILVKKPMNIAEIGAGLQALLWPGTVEESGALISFHASKLRFTSEKPIPWTLPARSPSPGPWTGSTGAVRRSAWWRTTGRRWPSSREENKNFRFAFTGRRIFGIMKPHACPRKMERQ